MITKNTISKIINSLWINAPTFFLYLKKKEGKIISLQVKQLRNIIINNEYTLDEFEKITSLKKEDLSNLFWLNSWIKIYQDYILYITEETIKVVKRENNWFIQSIYKQGTKDIIEYFNLFGINIITGDYTYEALADIIDLIWDHSLITALYNYKKNKPLYDDIENTSDLWLIEAQYKKVKDDYQDIINKFKLIYNNIEGLEWEELNLNNEKIILDKTAVDIAREANLWVYTTDGLLKAKHINYNSLILHSWDILWYINNVRDILNDSIFKKANIINIKSIDFVKKWYVIDIYQYKTDIDEYTLLYSNKEALVWLIEEKLAKQIHGDNRIKSQWNALKKTLAE